MIIPFPTEWKVIKAMFQTTNQLASRFWRRPWRVWDAFESPAGQCIKDRSKRKHGAGQCWRPVGWTSYPLSLHIPCWHGILLGQFAPFRYTTLFDPKVIMALGITHELVIIMIVFVNNPNQLQPNLVVYIYIIYTSANLLLHHSVISEIHIIRLQSNQNAVANLSSCLEANISKRLRHTYVFFVLTICLF
jgi:hypothetical protein